VNRSYWLPIAIAALVHLALALSVSPRFETDSAFYTTQARSLVDQGASLDATGRPETRYTPGYPLFLAAFLASGLGFGGAIAAQHALWIGIVAVTVWMVRRAGGSALIAFVAGLIAALDLPGLQSSISVLSETLAAATLLAAVCCTWIAMRAKDAAAAIGWCAAAGLLAGATALVRPIAIALGVPLGAAILLGADRRWRLRSAIALVAVFSVLPIFWTLRNGRETGVATLSSLAGINLLHFRAAATLAVRDPGGIDANLIRHRDALEARACRELEGQHGRPCSELSWAQRSQTYSAIAWPIILGDPFATTVQAARALGMIVLGGGASLLSEVTGVSERSARLFCLGYTVPLAFCFVAGIPYWWRRDRSFACLVLLIVAYMFGMALGAEAYSRFRVPVIALYGIVCAGGVAWLRDRVVRSQAH
jgi:4-amino-4-deoxy-L-arabinose transferase-like glycosyltransferase